MTSNDAPVKVFIPHCPNCGGYASLIAGASRFRAPYGAEQSADDCQYELESKVICDDCGMSTGYLPGLASLARWRDLVETKCFQVENEASE